VEGVSDVVVTVVVRVGVVVVADVQRVAEPVVLVAVEAEAALVDRVVQPRQAVGVVVLDAEAEVATATIAQVGVVVHRGVVVDGVVGHEDARHGAGVGLGPTEVVAQALVQPTARRLGCDRLGPVGRFVCRADAEGVVVAVLVVCIVPHGPHGLPDRCSLSRVSTDRVRQGFPAVVRFPHLFLSVGCPVPWTKDRVFGPPP
jgi:hypothetical protein